MNKTLVFSLVVLALAGVGGVLLATDEGAGGSGSCCPMMNRGVTAARTAAPPACPAPKAAGAGCADGKCPINPTALSGLDGAIHDLTAAEGAVKAGEKDKALKELGEVREFLEGLSKTVKPLAAPAPAAPPAAGAAVNDRCPIMGGTIDPAKVPADLTRQFKGQTVGFCCGDCPLAWDKLSDAEKEAKLDKVKVGK